MVIGFLSVEIHLPYSHSLKEKRQRLSVLKSRLTRKHNVAVFDRNGYFIRKWGNFGEAREQFAVPLGIAVDSKSDVYVVDSSNHRIKKYSRLGGLLKIWGVQGSTAGQFDYPVDVAVNRKDEICVLDSSRVQRFTSDGNYLDSWGSKGSGAGEFESPSGIWTDENNCIYVADSGNRRVQKFDEKGELITQWSMGEGEEDGVLSNLAVDPEGFVLVTDKKKDQIYLFSPAR